MMVTAVEQLVVSPAMPTIIAKLKGFEIYPWVISAYLLAATVSTPIYGKLADLFGRKRVLLFGLALFTLGSVLSGTSMSMSQLIAMRTIQGLGAGAVGPIVLTILGDVFTLQERARVQGLFSAVWGLSSIGGPAIGGYLTDYIGWRCVFLLCVPFSIAAIILLIYHVSEPKVVRTMAPIDWAGRPIDHRLVRALVGRPRWLSPWVGLNLSLLAAAAILMILFVIREHRAIDPILPLDLMMRPVIAASLVGSLLFGGILFGLDAYVPLYMQGVRGGSATSAGLALMPLFIAWAISVALAARAVIHHGFRRAGMIGSAIVAVGSLFLVLGASLPDWSRLCFIVGLAIVGTGMGPTSFSFILAVQNTVSWGQRGLQPGLPRSFQRSEGPWELACWAPALRGSWHSDWRHAGESGIDVAAVLPGDTRKAAIWTARPRAGQPRPGPPRRLHPDSPLRGSDR